MTPVRLELVGSGVTIDLNSIMDTEEGVQAVAGLTGLGLPPVSLQWVEGAGDGATFRGRRVLSRDIDLPLHIVAPERESLKAQVVLLSRALADRCTLRFFDSNEIDVWSVDCYRVGGGDYAYGVDSTGEHDMDLVVTLRTESSYWTREQAVEVELVGEAIGSSLSLYNPGSADAFPVWEVTGPGAAFKVVSPDGRVLHYDKFIPADQTIVIDTAKGTVRDQDGSNRYDGLAEAPRFFRLAPGATEVELLLDQESTEFEEVIGASAYNFVLNPTFESGLDNWTPINTWGPTTDIFEYDAANKRLWCKTSEWTTASNRPKVSFSVSELKTGQDYAIRPLITWPASLPAEQRSVLVRVTCGTTSIDRTITDSKGDGQAEGDIRLTPTDPTATVLIFPYLQERGSGSTKERRTRGSWVERVYVGEPGSYFDGDTTDTDDMLYDWEGTPHASRSRKRDRSVVETPTTIDISGSKVRCSFKPRDWMVV